MGFWKAIRHGTASGHQGDDADSCARLTPAQREQRAVAARVRISGDKYRTELASSVSHHWRQPPHLEAAWHDTPGGPGHPRHKCLNGPTGRVWFAGGWLSRTDARQHGTFGPARDAVTALHARVHALPAGEGGGRRLFSVSVGMPVASAALTRTDTRRSGHCA
ncbi:flavin monoamine oxidase family protein [Streptomyces shenzhenensis]|uniref:hypothetical protein n=1 Tax=Streptomyces shenzhenensis TaxID=943815 RepID=UPI00215D89B5|nr:hypothetical protein [Streptomyces shenzhenensis]